MDSISEDFSFVQTRKNKTQTSLSPVFRIGPGIYKVACGPSLQNLPRWNPLTNIIPKMIIISVVLDQYGLLGKEKL
jgi:hypothetical protein